VRRGYDALSVRYDEQYGSATKYRPWLAQLRRRIPDRAAVLDLGCGSGVPVASTLTDAEIARWLRPGGWFLCTTGHTAWTGGEDNWLDGGAAMWWSHADARTYRTWLTDAGFTVEQEQFVPEGTGGHALFWAQRNDSS
jgi:SAM-dependent methyltransferase